MQGKLGEKMRAYRMSLGLYTVLPGFSPWDDGLAVLLMPCLPMVGILIGILWLGAALLANAIMPTVLASIAVAITPALLTGFLHLDGLMDVVDAVFSARSLEEKHRILKDPHTGSFAVISLTCLMAVQVGASHGLLTSGRFLTFLILPVVSRALAAFAMMSIKPIGQSHYGKMAYESATQGKRAFCVACLVVAIAAAFLLGWRYGVSCLATAIGGSLSCLAAVRALSGMNGDIAGYTITSAEVVGLVVMACLR